MLICRGSSQRKAVAPFWGPNDTPSCSIPFNGRTWDPLTRSDAAGGLACGPPGHEDPPGAALLLGGLRGDPPALVPALAAPWPSHVRPGLINFWLILIWGCRLLVGIHIFWREHLFNNETGFLVLRQHEC